jgi:hypothetical protein
MLFLECNADETLACALGVPRRDIIHSHGKGKVSRSLRQKTGVLGLVDQDIGSAEPVTLSKFVEESNHHDVILKRNLAQGNRLIVLCPKLEDWIIKTAKAADVKMADFSLSERPGDLHADINQRLPNLERLLKHLVELKTPRIQHLKSLLAS